MGDETSDLKHKMVFPLIGLIILSVAFILYLQYYPSTTGTNRLIEYTQNFSLLIPKLFLLLLLFFIFKIISIIIGAILRKIKMFFEPNKAVSAHKIINFLLWIIFIIVAAAILFGNIAALITSLGLVGLGLTFALQKPISNFVGWLTIIVKGIYTEGDRIKVGNVRGDVKEIQLMNTVMYSLLENTNTQSYKIVTIPNEMVLTTDVENYTKESNYILEEVKISITYESNYRKAMGILSNIVTENIRNNFKSYIKRKKESRIRLEKFLHSMKNSSLKKNKKKLEKERTELQKEIDTLEVLEEEFQPRIRIETADSSILLIARFLTPYNEIQKNRTEINLKFLDAVAKEKNIEIAYPHMELVYTPYKGKRKKR